MPPQWDPSADSGERTSGGVVHESKNGALHRSEAGFMKPGSTRAETVQCLKPILDTTTYGGGGNDSSLPKQGEVEMENASGSGIAIEQMQQQQQKQQLRRYHSSTSLNLLPHSSRHARSNHGQQLAHSRHQTLGKINAGKGTAKTKVHGPALTPVHGESRLVKGGTRDLYVQVLYSTRFALGISIAVVLSTTPAKRWNTQQHRTGKKEPAS